MSQHTPSKRVSYMSMTMWSLMLVMAPLLFSACQLASEKEPFVASEGATVINDLQLAFMLPEGWWQNGEPMRAMAPRLEDQLTPEQLDALKESDPDALDNQEEDLQAALYMYMYHNLPTTQDSISIKPAEDIFYHALLLNVHTYYDDDILGRWARGECTRAQDQDCLEGGDPNGLELIRPLEAHENPFATGKGFLYQVLEAQVPVLSYIYYFVRNGWAYQVTYEITENERGEWQYPPVLDTIQFMK